MPSTIQIKNSAISGNTPDDLADGELAINRADGLIFYKNAENTIVKRHLLGNPFIEIPELISGIAEIVDADLAHVFYFERDGNLTIGYVSGGYLGQIITIIFKNLSARTRILTLDTTSSFPFRFGTDIPNLTETEENKTDYVRLIFNGESWDVIDYKKGF